MIIFHFIAILLLCISTLFSFIDWKNSIYIEDRIANFISILIFSIVCLGLSFDLYLRLS